ncbi:MAG: hypothetical protein Q4F81_08420 [Eubacteriales bacterium]|nr:hypothetical protein [Eubacteriales bacterium]
MKRLRHLLHLLMALALCFLLPLRAMALSDGEYCVSVELSGGSGKAYVTSPAPMTVVDGTVYAELTWSSANYDYMIVDGVRYDNLSEEGMYSTFRIPITQWDYPMQVIADTTAMGAPMEIHYQLCFYSDSVGDRSQLPQEAAKRVLIMASVIIVVGGILNAVVKRRRGA